MCGAVFVHHLPDILGQFGVDEGVLADKLPHILLTSLILAAPGLVCWATDALGRAVPTGRGPAPKPFEWIAYGYLPLVWAATFSHYLLYGLTEAGRILPVRPKCTTSVFC